MDGNSPYNAPILTNKITVNDVGTTINCDGVINEYEEFLFDNVGSKEILITIGTAVIKLQAGMYISIIQDVVTSVNVKTNAGETSTLVYCFQGYSRLV